jgi:hypothetical protein
LTLSSISTVDGANSITGSPDFADNVHGGGGDGNDSLA